MMRDDIEWAKIKQPQPSNLEIAGSGALRIAMLFGGLALAVALIATPILDRGTDSFIAANGTDPFTTASTRQKPKQTYTVRKSVLQKVPGSKCIIRNDGSAFGDC